MSLTIMDLLDHLNNVKNVKTISKQFCMDNAAWAVAQGFQNLKPEP